MIDYLLIIDHEMLVSDDMVVDILKNTEKNVRLISTADELILLKDQINQNTCINILTHGLDSPQWLTIPMSTPDLSNIVSLLQHFTKDATALSLDTSLSAKLVSSEDKLPQAKSSLEPATLAINIDPNLLHALIDLLQNHMDSKQIEPSMDKPSTFELLSSAAVYGAAAAAVIPIFGPNTAAAPEAISDTLQLLGQVSETNASYIKQATTLLFVALTGSWLPHGVGLITNTALKKAGCSNSTADTASNVAAFLAYTGKNITPVAAAAGVAAYAASSVSFWAEQRAAVQLRRLQQSKDITEKETTPSLTPGV